MAKKDPKTPAGATDPSNPFNYPTEDVEEGKLLAILGYIIPLVFLVPLIQKDNHFSLFHAKQVLLLVLGYVLVTIIGTFTCIGFVLYLPLFAFNILGLVFSIQGQYKPLPLIGNWAEDWFKGIKTGAKTIMNIEVAAGVANLCVLGNLSYILGRKLEWDQDKQTIVGDQQAQRMMSRPQRHPYHL